MESGYGHVHHDDIRTLQDSLLDVAARFSRPLKILEIGIWNGGTSRELRSFLIANQIVDIEHWTVDKRALEGATLHPPYPECHSVWGDSLDVAGQVPDGFHWIFVDGCHCLFHVLGDFALYAPKLAIGGLMLFHDVNPQTDHHYNIYQHHGDPSRRESLMCVRIGLDRLGLLPPVRRSDWELAFTQEKWGNTWWGGIMAFRKLEHSHPLSPVLP